MQKIMLYKIPATSKAISLQEVHPTVTGNKFNKLGLDRTVQVRKKGPEGETYDTNN